MVKTSGQAFADALTEPVFLCSSRDLRRVSCLQDLSVIWQEKSHVYA
jgi:hypothetical protein